jgi:hypothetical protein
MLDPGFPTTPHAFQPRFGGGVGDAFVTKVNRSGTALVYSTYLGGSVGGRGLGPGADGAEAIAVDSHGDAYVTGFTRSTDFPLTQRAIQAAHAGGEEDAFVARLDRGGSSLVYSTYLGGAGSEVGWAVAVGKKGVAYIGGGTRSADFPTSVGALQPDLRGETNGFLAALDTGAPPHNEACRDCRRAHSLRGWTHGTTQQVFP